MATVTLTPEEMESLDLACMTLNETVRLGRKKQEEYVKEGDYEGAEWMAPGIDKADRARVTLRSLMSRAAIDKAEGGQA